MINLVSLRTLKDPLFYKQETGWGLFIVSAVFYSRPVVIFEWLLGTNWKQFRNSLILSNSETVCTNSADNFQVIVLVLIELEATILDWNVNELKGKLEKV